MCYDSHKARKRHRCNPYFGKQCQGTGWIAAGETYYSPDDDCIDPFHPYRICVACWLARGYDRTQPVL
jgi:hypothetical protein